MADLGVWTVDGDKPEPLQSGTHVELEEKLEDWIVANPALLPGDLRIVGRQVHLEGGVLDILALDWQGRWVVVELKRGALRREVVAQAIDYAASIERLTSRELEEKLSSPHASLSDPGVISEVVRQQLQAEGENELRDVQVTVVGVGTDSGLERVADYLARFDVPLSVVSFRAFDRKDGPHLLVRDVIEEATDSSTVKVTHSLEAIRQAADEAGVGEQLERILKMSEAAELVVQPRKYAVRIAVPIDARHRLIYARPEKNGLTVGVSPDKFAQFYPKVTEDDVTQAIDQKQEGIPLSGADLDARLDQIGVFLEGLPREDESAAAESG